MATKTATRGSKRAKRKPPALAPTLGPLVCAWMERCLVHAEGDYYGQPFRLRPWQREVVYRAYELDADGRRRCDRVLVGFPKGQGKSELAAAFACAEFAGPVVFDGWTDDGRPKGRARISPLIPVAAASFEQADVVFGAARTMIREGLLKDFCEVYDTEILLKGRPGRLYRVAAAAGTNDGGKPTFWVADELHEWTGTKERVHLVLSNNRAKRAGAWELAITTAGWDTESLLGKLYQHGKRVADGTERDDRFLMIWREASPEWDLADPAQLEQAIRQANPAVGDFLPIEGIQARYREAPEHEFRRYHLNQWTTAPERWLPSGSWEAAAKPREIGPDEELVVGFDGSFSRDSTAIVASTLDRYKFVVACWEKPSQVKGEWRVNIDDVLQTLRNLCRTHNVRRIGCDPHLWREQLQQLTDEGLPIEEWPSHQKVRMVPACAQFYDGVTSGKITHDGDARLARHIANCVLKVDSFGPRIVKDHKDSVRHIDLAVAAVIADDLAIRLRSEPTPRWRPL